MFHLSRAPPACTADAMPALQTTTQAGDQVIQDCQPRLCLAILYPRIRLAVMAYPSMFPTGCSLSGTL